MPKVTDSYVSIKEKKSIKRFKETCEILKNIIEDQSEIIRKLKEIEAKK